MPAKRISPKKVKGILFLYASSGLKQSQLARTFKVSRSTVKKYITLYENSTLSLIDLTNLKNSDIINALFLTGNIIKNKTRYFFLKDQFPIIHNRLREECIALKNIWGEYKQVNPFGYEYSQFVFLYNNWLKENNYEKRRFNKWVIKTIAEKDLKVLKKRRLSSNRRKWERAVALLELHKGTEITKISKKIERSCRTIKKWRSVYLNKGIEYLDIGRTRKVSKQLIDSIKAKKERLIKLIHEPPSLHNINRTSWSLETLAQAYKKFYGENISRSTVSEYVRSEGYTFKKARKVLTSPDPEYRAKLGKITKILSNLCPDEKFFSIDEYGPFAIKIQGGRSHTHKDQVKTVPQRQKCKGSLICTAALELSTNQVTHFYSEKKNTTEMIKLLEILLKKYPIEKRIFFSWDAASWHASKMLYEKVEEVNDPEYRKKYNNPIVELAPLPSSAQFLNIIESVFSGMAKAIIHNSDYQSVEECKAAIDLYFKERNQAFIENPKRAGNKIWGEEIVKPVFKESNNCKDPNWR